MDVSDRIADRFGGSLSGVRGTGPGGRGKDHQQRKQTETRNLGSGIRWLRRGPQLRNAGWIRARKRHRAQLRATSLSHAHSHGHDHHQERTRTATVSSNRRETRPVPGGRPIPRRGAQTVPRGRAQTVSSGRRQTVPSARGQAVSGGRAPAVRRARGQARAATVPRRCPQALSFTAAALPQAIVLRPRPVVNGHRIDCTVRI